MKKLVTLSLFIFWAVVTAVMAAGLVFYQKNDPANCNFPLPINSPTGAVTLTLSEIAKHNSTSGCWLLINNKIYNVTAYLGSHPGGVGTIAPYCGKEATNAFNTKDIGRPHSANAAKMLTDYYIGDLNQKIDQQQVQQNIQKTDSVTAPTRNREIEDD